MPSCPRCRWSATPTPASRPCSTRLTAAGVYAQDQLFATLDPTLRRLALDDGGAVVLADTVGFISKLPHDLVAAFKSTLQETADADLLLHVIDAAGPRRGLCISEVNDVLESDRRPTRCRRSRSTTRSIWWRASSRALEYGPGRRGRAGVAVGAERARAGPARSRPSRSSSIASRCAVWCVWPRPMDACGRPFSRRGVVLRDAARERWLGNGSAACRGGIWTVC